MDHTRNDDPHQRVAIASASSGYKQGLKQTYAFWTCQYRLRFDLLQQEG
jgi:hypothetical protein